MSTPNPSQLFLLADHLKLSLLERQRAISLNLEPNSHDGQISRSLESLSSGIDALETQLAESADSALQEQIASLKSQYSGLTAQFHNESASSTLSQPNDPSLAQDFSAAQQIPRDSSPSTKRNAMSNSKSVRFKDSPSQEDPNRDALFPYRDDPDDDSPPDQSHLTNEQIHVYHKNVLREQDEQLDRLGESIGRQRELSMQIGDELDSQVMLLDDVEEGVDRHQSQINRARGRLDRVARRAKENWSMTIIVILIIVLVLLIVITK